MAAKEKNELRGPVFDGKRFKNGKLPLDMLPDLVTYQRLVNEAGRTLWEEQNPDVQRIPVTTLNETLALGLHEILDGSAGTLFLPTQESSQTKLFPNTELLSRSVDLVNRWFQAACEGTPIDVNRHVLKIMSRFGMKLNEEEFAKFGIKHWNQDTRRHVEQLSKATALPQRRVYVGTLVALSDTEKKSVTIQPLVGPRFEVPFDGQRNTLISGFVDEKKEGKPFIRMEILGLYFEKMLEKATSIENVSIIRGPEFKKRWSFILKEEGISINCKSKALKLLEGILIHGVPVRPYIYADEDEIVFEWPHNKHGVVIVRVGENVQLLTTDTDMEHEEPSTEIIAQIIGETQ